MTKDESMPTDLSPAKDDESGEKAPAQGDKTAKDVRPADKNSVQDDKSGEDEAQSAGAGGEAEPEISLHQFLRISGMAQDQAAGFVRSAQKTMPGRHALGDWKKALSDFWRAPAR